MGCVSEDRYKKMDEVKRKLEVVREKMLVDVKTIQQWRQELWKTSVPNFAKKRLLVLTCHHDLNIAVYDNIGWKGRT